MSRIIILLITIFLPLALAAPTPQMCRVFYRFISKYHSNKSTFVGWVRLNCDKIHPIPSGMTCDDINRFAVECNFDGLIPPEERESAVNANIAPNTLQHYMPYNRQTVIDYGAYGNWYYPNYYPWSEISGFIGPHQWESENAFTRGGNYPYHRSDNIVNQMLMQTSLPACLHDIVYCAKLEAAKKDAATYRQTYAQWRRWQMAQVRGEEKKTSGHRQEAPSSVGSGGARHAQDDDAQWWKTSATH